MADLTPAAQAVLDAATPALNNLDACGFNHQRYDRKALAAALRAAVERLGFQDDYGTRLINVDDLLATINELKNHQ